MKRPVFFISSTIYDFSDLRSALKFYLEKHGCKVLASEYNDFEKPLSEHSYEACLAAIEKADYFILFVGGRIGGWFDKPNKISITQQEYRKAYKLHEKNKIKIVNFVRKETWQSIEEIKTLIKELNIDSKNIPTKYIQNFDFTYNFIKEIGRNEETKKAIDNKVEPPTGNWIHIFSNFDDIIKVIDREIFSISSIQQMINKTLLSTEIKNIMRNVLLKTNDSYIFSPKKFIIECQSEIDFNFSKKLNETSCIPNEIWSRICFYTIKMCKIKFTFSVIKRILDEGIFLDFDNLSNKFVESRLSKLIKLIYEKIYCFQNRDNDEIIKIIFSNNKNCGDKITIKNIYLVSIFFNLQKWSDIIEISSSLILLIDHDLYHEPDLFPQSPLLDDINQIELEKITDDNINSFLNNFFGNLVLDSL